MFSTFLARSLAHNAPAALVLATALFGSLAMQEQTVAVDAGPTVAERLVQDNACWSGPAPRDVKRPGHAVVSDSTGHATYSRANVRLALEHVFDGKHPAITVHAFCR